jgi:dipeptidyl aminopeptidase/acylaminoacyl peptidase
MNGTRVKSVLAIAVVGSAATSVTAVADTMPPADDDLIGQIVYSVQNDAAEAADLFVASPDGSNTRPVPLDVPLEMFGGALWDPTGRTLLLTNEFRLPDPFRPAIVDPDGSNFRLVDGPTDTYCAAWSPDGSRILCAMGPDDDPGMYLVSIADGTDVARVSTNPFVAGGDNPGGFSPDGDQIVFVRKQPGPGREEVGAVFIVRADGTDERQITEWGIATSHDNPLARWSPDGSTIAFAGREGTLMLIHPDDTGPVAIDIPIEGSTFASNPGWSPDGSRIIFPMWAESNGQVDLYTVRPDGTDLIQITDTPERENFADWTPTEP